MQRRNTNQRQIVYNALDVLGHASIESLIEYIRMHYENISLATIYRNISILLDEKKVKRVKLMNEDVLETVKQDHFHFVCSECGNIFDLDCDKKEFIKQFDFSKHQINNCDVSLYGICEKCKLKENENNEICM